MVIPKRSNFDAKCGRFGLENIRILQNYIRYICEEFCAE